MAFIGNMDKTSVYFDLILNKVVDRVGVKSCIVKTTGAEKRHIAVTLTVTENGEMLPPYIISKGKRQPQVEVCTLHVQTCMHACMHAIREAIRVHLNHLKFFAGT